MWRVPCCIFQLKQPGVAAACPGSRDGGRVASSVKILHAPLRGCLVSARLMFIAPMANARAREKFTQALTQAALHSM